MSYRVAILQSPSNSPTFHMSTDSTDEKFWWDCLDSEETPSSDYNPRPPYTHFLGTYSNAKLVPLVLDLNPHLDPTDTTLNMAYQLFLRDDHITGFRRLRHIWGLMKVRQIVRQVQFHWLPAVHAQEMASRAEEKCCVRVKYQCSEIMTPFACFD